MARQIKSGIDYFSHDVDMMADKKMRLIFAKHGVYGIFIYERLIEACYKDKGYYLEVDEDFNILFCGDYNLDYNVYIEALNDYIERGLFDNKVYKGYNILTSDRIQKNYISGTERRKEVNFIKEYLLVKPSEIYGDKVNVNINPLNVDINSLNANIGTQSKVNKSKVDKNKVNKSIEVNKYGEYKRVLLSEKQYASLKEEWGEVELLRMITIMDETIETNPSKYKYTNFKAALKKWKKNQYNSQSKKSVDKWKGEQNFEF